MIRLNESDIKLRKELSRLIAINRFDKSSEFIAESIINFIESKYILTEK